MRLAVPTDVRHRADPVAGGACRRPTPHRRHQLVAGQQQSLGTAQEQLPRVGRPRELLGRATSVNVRRRHSAVPGHANLRRFRRRAFPQWKVCGRRAPDLYGLGYRRRNNRDAGNPQHGPRRTPHGPVAGRLSVSPYFGGRPSQPLQPCRSIWRHGIGHQGGPVRQPTTPRNRRLASRVRR